MLVKDAVRSSNWTPLGYQQITSLSSATSLSVPAGSRIAVVVAETQAVRWRDHGSDPTASVGMPLATGVYLILDGDLTSVKFIEQTSSAKLNVTYYG